MDYRYGSHTVYKIQYHFVFVTKYRYQVFKGDVGLKVREPIRQTCQAFEMEILKGVVSRDHVHLFVSAPPSSRVPSEIMRRIEGRSSTKRFESFPDLRKGYWGQHFGARGYFWVTSGELTQEQSKKYLAHHFDAQVVLNVELTVEESIMECPTCNSKHTTKNGSVHNGKQKYVCKDCGRQFV